MTSSLAVAPRLNPAVRYRSPQLAILGSAANVTLHVVSDPEPRRVMWSFATSAHTKSVTVPNTGGQPPTRFSVSRVGDDGYVLSVRTVLRSDIGVYTLSVANLMGSREFSVALTAPGPPAAPRLMEMLNCTARTAWIHWLVPFDGGFRQSYAVEVGVGQQPSSYSALERFSDDSPEDAELLYRVRSLQPSTEYTFRARSHNQAGAGPYGNLTRCTTKKLPVVPPESIRVEQIDTNVVKLAFEAPAPALFTRIAVRYCSREPPAACHEQTLPAEHTNADPLVLENANFSLHTYSYLLRVYDGVDLMSEAAPISNSGACVCVRASPLHSDSSLISYYELLR